MAVTLEELFKSSPRREIRSSKSDSTTKKNKRVARNTSLLETLAKNGGIMSRKAEDGTVKMKILVKKQDLKQMLEAMNVVSNNNNNNNNNNKSTKMTDENALLSSSLSSIERRLYDLMKKRKASQDHQAQQQSGSWRPALQSIPEEYC